MGGGGLKAPLNPQWPIRQDARFSEFGTPENPIKPPREQSSININTIGIHSQVPLSRTQGRSLDSLRAVEGGDRRGLDDGISTWLDTGAFPTGANRGVSQ